MYRRSTSLPGGGFQADTEESISLLVKTSSAADSKPHTLPNCWYAIRQTTDNSWPNQLCRFVCGDNFDELTKWQQINPDRISMRDCFGDTVLHLAVWNGQREMVEFLLKFININIQGFCGRTPLHWAVWANNYDIVLLLLEQGAILDIQDKECQGSPLHNAAINGYNEIVQMLLVKGPNGDLGDIYGFTPLHHATSKGHKEIVELLITHGVNVNAQTKSGWTPLHYAIRNREIDIVALLLKADVNVNIKDSDGISAFELAYENNLDITNLLLDNVVNLEVTDDASYKVIERAMRLNVPDVLRCLIVKDNSSREKDGTQQDKELTVEYLESRLDDCIGRYKRKIYINFSPLLPKTFQNFSVIFLIFLCITKEKKFEHLLLHPTVRIFFFWKWRQGAKYFYINLFIFLAICLNIILYQVIFYCDETDEFNGTCYLAYGFIIFSVVLLIFRESMQFYINVRSYVTNIENYYELALIVYLIVLLCWYPDFKTRIQISAIGNILIAVTVTMVIGHHPWATSAVHLLKMVTFKFAKYFIIYLVIILSFSLSFYQLYALNKSTNTLTANKHNTTDPREANLLDYPELSVLRTVGMFIGELNLTDFSSEKYSFVLILMLLSFIILVSIIILNLLNGLAISNVLEKSELKISHMKSQLEYLYNLTNTIDLIIRILDALTFAKFVTKKMPVTQLIHEVNDIFIVPSYVDCKTLLLTADQVLVRSNRIHRDAYERFKRKESLVEIKDKDKNLAANVEDIKLNMYELKDMILEVNRKNEKLVENVLQTKVEFREMKEKMLEILKQ